ncbi:SMI1/KNR4 family protein [Dactylosporangium sp. CA-139066]|uniref:SMI1/KNR4 family protein n=1 Tax=Dactylosporangium sp. CA-139066 TaxID=3239930 RepID=UPI003D8CAFA8
MERVWPAAQYALRLVSFGSPLVRERHDRGVLINPQGFPDWEFHARAVVRLGEVPAGLTVDEIRVVDVLAANAVLRRDGTDPLWDGDDGDVPRTPQGWTWAHLGARREVALVPIELHASFRHAGGVSALPVDRSVRGLRVDLEPVWAGVGGELQQVPADVLDELERRLGYALPPRYRGFLAQTNGAAPREPGVMPGFGFVADQRFFGLSRDDQAQDLIVANQFTGDRFTEDFLAIGWVQGGTIAVKVRGEDPDSIWYLDDDDDRADARDDAAEVTARLLHRCADSIEQFWNRLDRPAAQLLTTAAALVNAGDAAQVRPDGLGESLPPSHRAPWQPPRSSDEEYFADPAIQIMLLRQDEPA